MHSTDPTLPSVSFLGTVKSSSLAKCLCPSDPSDPSDPKGIDEGGRIDEWPCESECALVLVDVADGSDGGRSGLHGECELVEVLVEAPMGTPAAEGYRSWLNCKETDRQKVGMSIDHALASRGKIKQYQFANSLLYS
jgi:hypothetical protein